MCKELWTLLSIENYRMEYNALKPYGAPLHARTSI